MIIKRNGRKRSTDYYHPLSWGISIHSLALLRIHLPLHLPPPSSPLPSHCPSSTLLTPVSASTEPAVLLFIPTNGGSFCFTFNLISNDGDLELHLRLYCIDVYTLVTSKTKQFEFHSPFSVLSSTGI